MSITRTDAVKRVDEAGAALILLEVCQCSKIEAGVRRAKRHRRRDRRRWRSAVDRIGDGRWKYKSI